MCLRSPAQERLIEDVRKYMPWMMQNGCRTVKLLHVASGRVHVQCAERGKGTKYFNPLTCQQIADASQINHELNPTAYMWLWQSTLHKNKHHTATTEDKKRLFRQNKMTDSSVDCCSGSCTYSWVARKMHIQLWVVSGQSFLTPSTPEASTIYRYFQLCSPEYCGPVSLIWNWLFIDPHDS